MSVGGCQRTANFGELRKGEVRRMPPYSLENALGERSRWGMTKRRLRTTLGVGTFSGLGKERIRLCWDNRRAPKIQVFYHLSESG